MRSLRAQVTIFVILGLALLLVAALFFMARRTVVEQKLPPVDDIRTDFDALIASYEVHVEDCLQLHGPRVFSSLFSKGGFIDPLDEGFFVVDQFPTRGSALPFGSSVLPYWFEHKGGVSCSGSCSFVSHVPSVQSIASRARLELLAPVSSCVEDFSFSPDYTVDFSDDFDISVSIGADAVHYEYVRDVVFTDLRTDNFADISVVSASQDAYVIPLLELASSLVQQLELNNASASFADTFMEIISVYSLTDDAPLPPPEGGMSFGSRNIRRWFLPEVQDELSLLLADNIPFLQITGSATETLFLEDNLFSESLYHGSAFRPQFPLPYMDLLRSTSIDFVYQPDWGIDLAVSPSSGFIIEPSVFDFGGVPLLGLERLLGAAEYRFSYDLRVPVVVVLSEPYSFGGQGLTLMFAVETGLRDDGMIINGGDLVTDLSASSLFSNDRFGLDDSTLIEVVDAVSDEPLVDARVQYTCGDASTTLGQTNQSGELLSFLPFCLGGVLSVAVDGYASNLVSFDAFVGADAQVTIPAWPLKTFSLRLRSLSMQKVNDTFELGNQYNLLGPDDTLMLILTRRGEPSEREHVVVKNIDALSSASETVELFPGLYDLEAYLIQSLGSDYQLPNFVIPEDEVCYDEQPLNPFNDLTCETIPEIVFNDSMMRGGVSFIQSLGLSLNVSPQHYANDTLTVRYIELPLHLLEEHEDLGALGKVDEFSQKYNETLMPVFTKS